MIHSRARSGPRGLIGLAITLALAASGGRAHAESAGPDSSGLASRWARIVRVDARNYLSRRTGVILVAGGALTALSRGVEDHNDVAGHLTGSGWDHVADVGNAYGHPALLGAGALALTAAGAWRGDPTLRRTGSEACRSLVYTYAAVGALKLAVSRRRPNGGEHSFPSGHAAGVFAIAPVLARRLGPAAAVPAYALAVVTAIARVQSREHHLSDVVFGAALGTSVGLAVSRPGPAPRAALSITPERAELSFRF